MSTESLVAFCRSLPNVTEDIKWGDDLVFSIGGKMFAVFDLRSESRVSFKATAASYTMLTERDGIGPAPYLARYNWVLVQDLGVLPTADIRELISESYQIVLEKLPSKVKKSLQRRQSDGRRHAK